MPTPLMRAAFAGLLVVGTFGCSEAPPPQQQLPPPAPAPVMESQIAPDLPVLHANINMGARPADTVRAVYDFAARHPEVLDYVPCFCGCERLGHKGNEDCFVGARDKQGHVTEWETHGLICEVCIDVADEAMKMHDAGASVAAIRTAIEKRYADRTTHTPTPAPPGKGH